MYHCNLEERERKELAPGVTTRTFWGDNMLLSYVDFEPNAEVPLHQHPHEQAGILLEGELTFTIDGEVKTIEPGAMNIIPGNVVHGCVAGSQGAKTLEIFSPVREEFKY